MEEEAKLASQPVQTGFSKCSKTLYTGTQVIFNNV